MNIIKQGNDAVFSLFIFKDGKSISIGGEGKGKEPLNIYDPSLSPRLRESVRVQLEHLYPTYFVDVPYYQGSGLNEIRVELPEELQQLGDFNVVVSFEYQEDMLLDKWRAVCLKGFLCKVVETDREVTEATDSLSLIVSPILKGDKPVLTLEKVPDKARYYLKDQDGYIETADGHRAFLPAETTALIDYAPHIPTPIKFYKSWDKGRTYGWMPSDDEHFRGKFFSVSSASEIGGWHHMGYAITPPWRGFRKDGFYIHGIWVDIPQPSDQPIAEALSEGRRFALVARVTTDGEGMVSFQGNNSKTTSVKTPDGVACDVAFPVELNTGGIRFTILTPNTTKLGDSSFLVSDFRFVELDKDDKSLDRLYY